MWRKFSAKSMYTHKLLPGVNHYAILASWRVEHNCKFFLQPIIMTSFNFDTWCTATKLTETSVDILKKEDFDTKEALQLLTLISPTP